MRRELLRSAPHPHSFPPRGGPLAKFGPMAAHPTHPGGGIIYSPTCWAPERWEASRMQTHPHKSPPRGEPLTKFGTAAAHPTHPGGGEIYPPTGWAPDTRESPRIPPHPHDFPPRGGGVEKFGPQPTHTIPHMEGSLVKFSTQGEGGHPYPKPSRTHQRGGGGSTDITKRGVRGATVGPLTPPTPTPIPTHPNSTSKGVVRPRVIPTQASPNPPPM